MPDSTPAPVPIGIRSLVVENFRGIRSLELKFIDAFENVSDIAVLAGPNGGGKTSVLEACLLVLGHSGLVRGATASAMVHAGAPHFQITAELYGGGEYREVTVRGDCGSERPSLLSRQVQELPCLYFSSWRAPKLVGPVSVTAGRRGKRPAETEENRLWLVKQFLVNAKAHAFMSGAKNGETGSLFEVALRQLNEVWKAFYPRRDQSFSVEPVAEDPDAGFDVVLVERDGTRIPLDSLGSGELEIFAFFGALLRSRFQEGVVVIDEPELHLDRQWHRFMLRAIQTFLPRVQLVVATHSPEVAGAVYSFQRHLLLPPGDPRHTAWKTSPSGVAG